MPQIFNEKKDLNKLADHFITCKTCFQSEQTLCKDVLISCRWETDEKEICKWSSCEDCRVYKSARAFINLIHFFASMGPSSVLSKNSYSYIQSNNNKKRWKWPHFHFIVFTLTEAFQKYITNLLVMFVYPAGNFHNMTKCLPVLHRNVTM